jgi:methionine-rich copper-binding protein CopC
MNVPTMNKQIIFVDSSVQDYQSLIQGIDPAQIVILNENFSAIDQITSALADQKDIEAVHIVSHGSEGSLKLGADVLNDNNLETFSDRLKHWGNALTANGDILLYGCDVAAGEVGENFVKRLSEITGADVAASTDKTGNAALGGDWELEKTTGAIEAGLAFSQEAIATYAGVLATPVQFDFTSVFDRDVIINYTGGVTDTTQSGLDSLERTLITQSFATFKAGANGNGLPDNGFFATNAYHPDVQLGYNNNDNGNNAKVLTTNDTSFNFAVTPNQYSEIHLFATSTHGNAGMQVTFNYSDGTTGTGTATVPDWFDEITETSSSYYLIDGMDRSEDTTGTIYSDDNDPAIFGFMFNPDPAKTLQSITVSKTSGTTADNSLGVFGATGVLETTAPTAASFTPTDNATSVAVAADLVVTLSEAVQKGTGNIVIKKVADNSVVETIDVTSANVTVSGSSVTINPTADLAPGTDYYVEIATGAIQDLAGNNYAGTTGATAWNFTTAAAVDTTPPTAASFTPADNATNIAVAADLVVTLSEAVQKGTGNIVIKKVADNSVVETIDVTSANVTVSGSSVTINPTADLAPGTDYYVEIATGAIQDLAGNNYAGTTGATAWNFTTAAAVDTTPPTAASFTPADNATNIAVAADLVVTLSEAVQKGTGNIVIKKVADNSVVETIDVTSANVTVSGSSVTINPTADLAPGTDYYVEIATGAIQDLAGNNYAGTTGATAWNFTTAAAVDTTPPTAASFTPADNATNIAVAADLVVTLSEAVQKGTGNIVIKKVADNSVVETIDVTSANVTVSGSSVTINPTADLAPGTDYYVEIATGAIQDLAGNNYAGTTGATAWNFTTAAAVDTTPPTAASFTPADNATNIAVAADLVVTLSEAVQKGTGNIVIKKVADNSVVETIDVTSANVTVSGSSVTINPTADLAPGTDYYVEIATGAIQDLAGNNYAGTTGATAWNFTTAAAVDTTPPTAASFTPADNATNIAVAADLVVTLSEAVQKGTGNIVIKKVADNSVVETIDVTSANVTVSGSSVTINPTLDLVDGTDYYVEIAAGAIKDLAGNNYAGTTGATAWNFTTAAAVDTTPPTAASFTPADNATNIAVAADLVVTLSEAVQKGTGNIVIKKVC